MLDNLLTGDLIEINKSCDDWKEAIHLGCNLLINKGTIDRNYEKAIIKNIIELGAYMVIMPHVILAHSKPEEGVKQSSISFVTLEKGVNFGHEQNDPVKFVITLASKNKEKHIQALTKLVELFRNNEDLNGIFNAKNKNQVLDIMKKYK